MQENEPEKNNPLGMKVLSPYGGYVLPTQNGTKRRREFFQRENYILGFYVSLAFFSNEGKKALERTASQIENFSDTTPIRITGLSQHITQMPYSSLMKLASNSVNQLTNQVFIMIYGNFEAFILDLVYDSLSLMEVEHAQKEAIRITMMTRWQGKIDRMREKFKLDLPEITFRERFADLTMEFQGESCRSPIEWLEKLAEFRHRLVHSAGRADVPLIDLFSTAPIKEGEQIILPSNLPFDLHFFFALLTDVIDLAFAKRFSWPRTSFQPEKFVENDISAG